jgi:hypothetical protein
MVCAGLRYEYGMFKQSIVDGWQKENPDNWLRDSDPWEIARPHEKVEIKLNCSFQLRERKLHLIPDRPSSLIGIPFDRPVVGYGGKTINTLRLWAAAAPDYFDFQKFGAGNFVGALAETLEAELPGYCIRMIPRRRGKDCASCRNISWSRFQWPTWCAGSNATISIGTSFPIRRRYNLMTRTLRCRWLN